MNHRNRTVSFLLAAAILTVHFQAHGASPAMWGAMFLQFVVAPHLQYAWAHRTQNPLVSEIRNMLIDNLGFGMWAVWLGFPLWITGLMVLGGCMNLAAFRGAVA